MTEARQGTGSGAVRLDVGRRMMLIGGAGYGLRLSARAFTVGIVLAALTLAVTIAALSLGSFVFSPAEVAGALLGHDGPARMVVLEWRAPRALAAAVFGAALAVSGAIFQSLTRNPLASPDLIGFSAGSFTGALVVMLIIGGGFLQVALGALIGGLLTAAAVYALAFKAGIQGFRLIIVGIGATAMLGAFNAWLMLVAKNERALSAAFWGAGSLSTVGWPQFTLSLACLAVLLVGAAGISRGLRQLELGDDTAVSLGVRTRSVWLRAVVVGVGLTAVVTAAAGPISFIALAAPQLARRLTRSPGTTLTASALLGALLLAAADLIAQHALPHGIPVGIVVVVLGGAYLAWLLVRERRTAGSG